MNGFESALSDKVVVITGASSGLGREAALRLAPLRPRLYLVVRDRARGERVAEQIAETTGNPDTRVLVGDLSSKRQVERVAREFLETGDPLHVLLNNAGAVFGFRRQTSDDGIEMTFALNHLGYFTFTLLLLQRLHESAPARIVNVTGDAYKDAKGFDFDDWNASKSYRPIRQYGRSKLANILFTRELAARLRDTGITVNAVGPSRTTATRFAHSVHPLAKVAMRVAAPFLLSPAKGVEPIVHLCVSPEVEALTGSYWSGMRQPPLTAEASSLSDARRLWELSVQLTGTQ